LLALACNWILASSLGAWAGRVLRAGAPQLNANDPRAIVYYSSGRVLGVMALLIVVVGWILGRFINTNRFSLHYYWRNRLMRAYLGASRKRAKTKNNFTDFRWRRQCADVRVEAEAAACRQRDFEFSRR